MENSLPKLTPTATTQILIHPDHASGTLQVPTASTTPPAKSNHKFVNTVSIVIIVLLLGLLMLSYFAIPRTRAVLFARSSAEQVTELNDKTDKVSDTLEALYASLYGAEVDPTNEISTSVLGVSTIATYKLIDQGNAVAASAQAVLTNSGQVKAFSIPEADPNKETRQQRQIATEIDNQAESASELLPKLDELTESNVNNSAKKLKDSLNSVSDQSSEYLSEAQKTSAYYTALSDASIELYNLSSSLQTEGDLETSISKLTAIREKFASYDKDQLPKESEELNKDVVAIFDVLIKFFNDVSTIKTESQLLTAYASFMGQTQTLAQQSSSHEISFWQNNQALANYKKLSTLHDDTIKQAENVKEANSYFLLPLLGVK